MNIFAIETITVLTMLAGVVLWLLAEALKSDGYGLRPAPRSNYHDQDHDERTRGGWLGRLPAA